MKNAIPVVLSLLALIAIVAHAFLPPRIYINAVVTTDGNGSLLSPYRSPVAALKAVRERQLKGAELVFAPGTYELPEGLELDARDTNLCLRARKAGTVRLTRSITVPKDGIVPCAAPPPPAAASCFGTILPHAPLFFYDHRWAVSARWPNEGWAYFTEVVDSGLRSECKPGISPDRPAVAGSFVFPDSRPERWNLEDGVYLAGYFTHDWSFEQIRIESYSASNRVMKLAGPARFGLNSGTWSTEKGRRIYAYNVRSELDAPGEYFWDRQTGKVDFIAPTNGVTEFRVAVNEGPIVTAKGAVGLKFRGLCFEYAAGDGLRLEDCRDCRVENCTIANVGGNAVTIKGGERCAVTDSRLDACGLCGVEVIGGDRRRLTACGHRIAGCDIFRYGTLCRCYATGVRMNGVGITVSGNRFTDAPHTAVLYGGNDHLIESNEVWDIMRETGDAGAFYTGRDPTSYGNVLRFNYVHDIGRLDGAPNTMAFYLDDCDVGDTLISNRIVNVARGMMVGGGHHNLVLGNVFERCRIGISVDARGVEWNDRWDSKIDKSWQITRKVQEMKPDEEPWCSRYPRLKAYLADHPREPRHIRLEGNVFRQCEKPILLDMKAQYQPLIEQVNNVITP